MNSTNDVTLWDEKIESEFEIWLKLNRYHENTSYNYAKTVSFVFKKYSHLENKVYGSTIEILDAIHRYIALLNEDQSFCNTNRLRHNHLSTALSAFEQFCISKHKKKNEEIFLNTARIAILQPEEIKIVSTPKISVKDVPKFIRENVEQIAFGDFSFADGMLLNDKDKEWLQLYEGAFGVLGEELASDCINSPHKIIPLYEMFSDYQHKTTRHREVKALARRIPSKRKDNTAVGYINAFVTDESKRCLLRKFFVSESSALNSIVDYEEYENDEAFILLKKFLNWCTFDLIKEIEQLFEKLYAKDKVQQIIKARARKQTLEQIGNHLGITRERVRQIESKTKRSFSKLNGRIKIILKISAERNGDLILTPAEIGDYCDANTEDLIYLLQSFQNADYIYDRQLDVFIVGEDSLQDRVQSYLETIPDIITIKQLDEILFSANEDEGIPKELLEKAFIDSYQMTGNVYHRTRLSLVDIYTMIIDKYYPNGIKVYDSEEMKTFRDYVAMEYGDIRLPNNDRALAARITSFCILCGRGTYMLKKKQYMPKKLSNRIYEYIISSKSPIFLTNTLFSVFERELVSLGIDNKYYLQGILRELFGDAFIFSRDYISKDPDVTSIYSTIVAFINKSEYPVNKKQIQQAFPGVTEAVINFAISDPNILNYFGEYLHVNSISISEAEKEYLEVLIEKIVSDGNAHHCRYIHEKINRERPEILTRNAAMLPFSTFSFLENLFRDQYQFARPYIAQKDVDIGRPAERLHDQIYSFDEFTVSDISEFCKENHFQILSLLDFVNSCNDQFLLVDGNTIMKIEQIGLTEDMANYVEDLIISQISETTPFCQLSLWNKLPSITVPWTDWLLYSVINKWGKKTVVSTTSNQFRLSVPLVAPAGKMDASIFKDFDTSIASTINIVDNLDNIDELLEETIHDEIWEIDT